MNTIYTISIRQKIILFLLISLILMSGFSVFGLKTLKIEAEPENQINTENLSLVENNSLIGVSDPAPEFKVVRKVLVIATAYSSTIWETDEDPFTTAAGTQVRDGIIANNYFPMGTKVRIPELYGDKIFVIEDRMSWKKGNYQIDIWFSSYQTAKEFGAKKTYMEILES